MKISKITSFLENWARLAVLMLAFAISAGCGTTRFFVDAPSDLRGFADGNSPRQSTEQGVSVRVDQVEDKLVVILTNSEQGVVELTDLSKLVDSQGQLHPLLPRSINSGEPIRIIVPPRDIVPPTPTPLPVDNFGPVDQGGLIVDGRPIESYRRTSREFSWQTGTSIRVELILRRGDTEFVKMLTVSRVSR